MTLQQTIANKEWLRANEDKIKEVLPEHFTHPNHFGQTGMLQLGFRLKLLGADWRSNDELVKCMTYFEKLGFIQRQPGTPLIRRNPEKIFP